MKRCVLAGTLVVVCVLAMAPVARAQSESGSAAIEGLTKDDQGAAVPGVTITVRGLDTGGQLAPIQPPNDGFFQTVTYIGAVAPAPAADWTAGWTAYPQR